VVFVGRFRDRDGAGEGRDVYAVSLRGGGREEKVRTGFVDEGFVEVGEGGRVGLGLVRHGGGFSALLVEMGGGAL